MRWLALVLVLAAAPAWAHKPSDAHLQITASGDRLGGSLAVAIRDLDGALDLDADGDGAITWAEVQAAAPRIAAYETERLLVAGCTLTLGAGALVDFSDGAYWTVPIDGRCDGAPDRLAVTYKLLFDIDAQHRGIVQLASPRATRTAVARSATPIELELGTTSLGAFAAQGLWHALTVPQHTLVLLLLLLPLAGRRRELATTAGAFGLAALAGMLVTATGVLHLPGALVEAGLALTAIVAAAVNLTAARARWELAFELGLVHGFGFALWVAELDAPAHRLGPLVGFGAGMLLGLALIPAVLRFAPLPRKLVVALSAAALALAAVWLVQVL